MNAVVTVKYDPRALVLNAMVFGMHAIAMQRSFAGLPAEGSIALQIGSDDITGMAVSFHLSTAEARQFAEALTSYAELADAKCAELGLAEEVREHYEAMAREAGVDA